LLSQQRLWAGWRMADLDFANSVKGQPLRKQVAPLTGICTPVTIGCYETTDIGLGGLRQVALRNKTGASLDHSPCEIARLGPMALAVGRSTRSGQERQVQQAKELQGRQTNE
jgi:hypothetical protein